MSTAASIISRGDPDSAGFWAAVDSGVLALCRCAECNSWLQPPLERCRHCGGVTTFERATGRGVVYSYIVVRHPGITPFAGDVPYVIVLVELDEGVRLPGRLLDGPDSDVQIGRAVFAEIVDSPSGEPIVAFRLDDG